MRPWLPPVRTVDGILFYYPCNLSHEVTAWLGVGDSAPPPTVGYPIPYSRTIRDRTPVVVLPLPPSTLVGAHAGFR